MKMDVSLISDSFLELPVTARFLYLVFGIYADKDGHLSNPRAVMRSCNATENDFNILIEAGFIEENSFGIHFV